MLLFIDDSFVKDIIYKKDKMAIDAIDLIANGRKAGNHFLLSTRNNLKLIKENNNVSNVTKNVFSYLYENYPILAHIKDKISYYIKIISGQKHMKLYEYKSTKICEVSYDYFKYGTMDKTIILAENFNDLDFYKLIAEYYKENNNLSSLIVNYEPRMGGGDTTHESYSRIQNEEIKLCLCIVDSDKKYPESDEGNTLKKIKQNNNPKKLFSQFHSLKAREIENLIPLNILKHVANDSEEHKKGYETLTKIAKSEAKKSLQFIDIKKGLSINNYINLKDKKHKNFIDNLCIKSEIFKKSELNSFNSINNNTPNFTNIINGLGHDILRKTINYLKDNKMEPDFDFPEQKNEWDEVGQLLISWTCSGGKIFY